jgi:molecular chaperone DnaJ
VPAPGCRSTVGDLFGGAGDVFGGPVQQPGRARPGTPAPRRGADLEAEVTLSFSDAVSGATVPLRLARRAAVPGLLRHRRPGRSSAAHLPDVHRHGQTSRNAGGFAFSDPCRECRGRGLVVDDPCPNCSGSGRAMGTRSIQVRLPAGVADGQRVRLRGKGAPGERGGPAGDLLVLVHVTPHAIFGRRGEALTMTVPVSFAEAALGAEVKVPTLGGAPVTLRLPPGTANGRTFRVRGKGVPGKDGTRGDLLVTVEVAVPQKLSGDARAAVERLAEATAGHDPRAGLFDAVPAGPTAGATP